MVIIGITGTSGSGKGTIVDYLIKNKGFNHFSVSGFIKDVVLSKNLTADRNSLIDTGNDIRRKYGPDHIIKLLFKKAKDAGGNAVIESIRNPLEAKYIKENGGILLAIDADVATRYKRITKRKSEKDYVSFLEFKNQESKESQNSDETAQNIPLCIKMADFKIENNKSIKKLYEKIEIVYKQIG